MKALFPAVVKSSALKMHTVPHWLRLGVNGCRYENLARTVTFPIGNFY